MPNKTTGKNPYPPEKTTQKARVKKSEKLTDEEREQFEKWIVRQDTLIDAADLLEVHRGTLDRVKRIGSGNPETISKIRSVIGNLSKN